MPSTNNPPKTVLIAAITPYFLERGTLWFEEHTAEIRKKALADAWWREHTLFVETGAKLPYSPFLRTLADMGYAKTGQVEQRGEFATRGGIVDIFPINLEHPIRLEFSGNVVERVLLVPLSPAPKPGQASQPKDPTEYERLWLASLRPGDYLVHLDHGIGIFRGFEGSYYILEYAPPRTGGMPDRLLVPRQQARKLSRYIGFETPVIHRLGGTAWESTKRKAKEEARKFAEELITIFRERGRASRLPYPRHAEVERHLEHSFPYKETEDQKRAIAEIHDDLSAERPMDRLLLGDVGFGKTEVAIRAAARVAYSSKQVAFLSPTTILADQHSSTFCDRLSNLPLEIRMLTRLTPKRNVKRIVREIASGKADIVIGTHRLLSRDIAWHDLGLVVIDEEQRFGVSHKERFKKLRAEIDILSLSATPIPRTLSLALAKFRDISFISEPPPGRLPIQTFVLPYSKRVAAEAIAVERRRGGQIFYLWNRIENIEAVRRDIERIAPNSRIAILHGRMREPEIIGTMRNFRAGNIDILLATTIIENGLDLPGANTLIVANAARLGLAQAYQLRGRIGRGDTPAYAYLLYPPRSLTEKGKLRLEALKEAEGLGAGFQIALKDLEIRGAGNVLGKQQSGTMNRVGLNLYAQLLGEALEELRE